MQILPTLSGGQGFSVFVLVMKFSRGAGCVHVIKELEEGAPEGPSGRGGGAAAAAASPELTLAEVVGGRGIRCHGEKKEEGGLFHHDYIG